MRSRVQREVSARVANVYGLDPAPSPAQVIRNKERVEVLLNDSAFHHEVCTDTLRRAKDRLIAFLQVPETREGRFQHPFIQQIIHAVWFSHRNALGCLYQERFNPIPHATVALVLTSVLPFLLSLLHTLRLVIVGY